MGFTSEKELYIFLLPVLNTRRRINRYYGYNYENIEVWNYLKKNKWYKSNNLQLFQIVNDIINMDIYSMKRSMKYE